MNLKLLSLLEKSLADSEKILKMDENKLKILQKDYNIKGNDLEILPKLIQDAFPQHSEIAFKLKDHLRNENHEQFIQTIKQSSNFLLFKKDSNVKYDDIEVSNEKIILAKTFNICPSSSTDSIYQQQVFDLKHL